MILRRLVLFFALLFGTAMTQLPEYVEQYRQRLGGAIDELTKVVTDFDGNSQQHGLSEQQGIERLRANPDHFVQQTGTAMQENIARLQRLVETQKLMQGEGSVGRLTTFVTHYDPMIASRAYQSFEPAVPVSLEALALGAIGFVFGGSLAHLGSWPLRRRRRPTMIEA
jgi:hypothetical protein